MQKTHDRFYYLDYVRAFFILLVVFDHTIHGYAESFGRFWFIQDPERDILWDGVHLLNYAMMLPGLFFVAGVFTPISLERRGIFGYFQERILKLLLPMAVGVATASAVLTYFKAQFKGDALLGFWDYYLHTYFQKDLALTGFWFLGYLFVFTTVYLLCSVCIPLIPRLLKKFAEKMEAHPVVTYWMGGVILAPIFTLATLRFGSWYSLGYKYFHAPVGYLVGSYILLFILGAAVGLAKTFQNNKVLAYLSDNLTPLLGLTLVWCILYLIISLGYMNDGSFSDEIHIYFARGGSWRDVGPLLSNNHLVSLRGAVHGFVTWSLLLSTIGIFYKYLNKPHPLWQTLAANSFVIYLIHEPFVLYQHTLFLDTAVPLIMRVIFITSTSLGISWFLSEKVLRKISFLKRILG